MSAVISMPSEASERLVASGPMSKRRRPSLSCALRTSLSAKGPLVTQTVGGQSGEEGSLAAMVHPGAGSNPIAPTRVPLGSRDRSSPRSPASRERGSAIARAAITATTVAPPPRRQRSTRALRATSARWGGGAATSAARCTCSLNPLSAMVWAPRPFGSVLRAEASLEGEPSAGEVRLDRSFVASHRGRGFGDRKIQEVVEDHGFLLAGGESPDGVPEIDGADLVPLRDRDRSERRRPSAELTTHDVQSGR